MKHEINELYRVNGKNGLYTYSAALNISTQASIEPAREALGNRYYFDEDNNGNLVKKNLYLVGEHTWFDSEEKRTEYKTNRDKELNRKKMLKQIMSIYEDMDEEKLKKIYNGYVKKGYIQQ